MRHVKAETSQVSCHSQPPLVMFPPEVRCVKAETVLRKWVKVRWGG